VLRYDQRLRRLLNPAFSRRLVEALAPRFTAVCEAAVMSQSPVSRSGPFWEFLEGRQPAPKAAATLGWELSWVAPERGEIEVFFDARDSFTNPMGNVQGGFLAAMLDDTLGPALVATLPDGQFAPTLELKVSFLRPAAPGRITGTGRVVHRGGSIAFLAGELRDEAGELLATATATARIIRPAR
jgi:uncharacterized protein (TIGR00369 family)